MKTCNRIFKTLVILLLLPGMILHSSSFDARPVEHVIIENHSSQFSLFGNDIFSYDDILNLIDQIESRELDDCDAIVCENITNLFITLARIGVLPGEDDTELALENDIEALLCDEDHFISYDRDDSYQITPAHYYEFFEILTCKSWVQKRWHHTRKFIKHHKKEVLIAAAIVVAAVVTVGIAMTVTPAVASTALATAGSAAAGIGAANNASHHENASEDNSSESSSETQSPIQSPVAQQYAPNPISDQITAFKEVITEEAQLESLKHPQTFERFKENVRLLGSGLAHDALNVIDDLAIDPIADLARVDHQLVKIENWLSGENGLKNSRGSDLLAQHQQRIADSHRKIDELFSTNLAEGYTPENRAARESILTAITLPPPGMLSQATPITRVNEIRGWKVGEEINNLTRTGKIPSWDAVRQRYWKDQAMKHANDGKYLPQNLERMRKGLAPQQFNKNKQVWESKELHHIPPQSEGGLFDVVEVWPDEHAAIDPRRRIGE